MHGQVHRRAWGSLRGAGVHDHLPDRQGAVDRTLGQLLESLGYPKHPNEPRGRALYQYAPERAHLIPNGLLPARPFGPEVVAGELDTGVGRPCQLQSEDRHGFLSPGWLRGVDVTFDRRVARGAVLQRPRWGRRFLLRKGGSEVKLRFRRRRIAPRVGSSSSRPGRVRRRGGSWHPGVWPRNPITLHSIAYGIPAHPQQPRRSGHIAPALHQCLPDLRRLRWQSFFWHQFQWLPENSHGGLWSPQRLTQTGQCLRVDLSAHVQQGRPLHYMA
jgi:hypothetical protein